ncbi:MAG: UDP-2,3-diacylglucosamine diphosphatase LpxI [Pirellulaceae bacterium]|nr:UDP-2,3-diacylglucosamine diphosphatase LpxI [Pirellulaceae bacterium]
MMDRIGILAGWGRFPVVVAEKLKQQNKQVYCLGIKDHADPQLADICDGFVETGIAKLGAHMRFYQSHKVQHATMAGKIFKAKLLYQGHWIRHLPDWTTLRFAGPNFVFKSKNCNDNALLLSVVAAYAAHGITFAPATDFAPELLVKHRQESGRRITSALERDIEFGWQIAKEMGRLDIGQTVIVKDRAIVAVEAIEGTDECIRRAGTLCCKGGFTVVKVAKPQQDMRFDVPTIGLGTLEMMAQVGGRVLVVESEKTIIIDEQDVIEFANKHNIAIITKRDGEALCISGAA